MLTFPDHDRASLQGLLREWGCKPSHAGRLLRSSELPIVDVASAVGFADHPSFSRAFARYMGMTPSEYRRLGPL